MQRIPLNIIIKKLFIRLFLWRPLVDPWLRVSLSVESKCPFLADPQRIIIAKEDVVEVLLFAQLVLLCLGRADLEVV